MRPLEGIKVLDLSRVLAGPTASMILADLGADVIKVERPGKGDETRTWGPPFKGGESAYYMSCNRNKKSITLDLKKGREILNMLIKGSDVIILNFLPSTLSKLKLTYEDVKKVKGDIIWASITGFGLTGPLSGEPGYDVLIQGLSGFMSITGEREGPPMKVGVAICDIFTALYTVIAIMAALRKREITGEGAMIDNSLLECSMASLANVAANFLIGGKVPQRYGNQHPNIVPYQAFLAKDDYFILAVGNDLQFKRLCEVIGRPELSSDSRFKTNPDRLKNRDLLIGILENIFREKPRDYWVSKLKKANIPVGPVRNVKEAFTDPHINERGFLQNVKHPTAEKITLFKNPIHMDGKTFDIYMHPPLMGEHTEEILNELGFSREDIINLREEGVI